MYVRVTTSEVGPDGVDAAVKHFEEVILPQARAYPGWKGSTFLVDRQRGVIKSLAYWESREAIEASDVGATRLRAEFHQKLEGSKLVDVEVFEIALQVGAEELAMAA